MDVITIKEKIYKAIQIGDITDNIISLLIKPDGTILPKECELWDFKESFDGTKDSYIKLLKSVVSFHNTYGGYIIFGVTEEKKDTIFRLSGIEGNTLDQQKLRANFDKYFGERLDLSYEEHLIESQSNGSDGVVIGLLHIPQRPFKKHTVAVVKDAHNTKQALVLQKNAVYIRTMDECKQALSQRDFEFAVSPRDFTAEIKGIVHRKNIIEHNLPDKNFICPKFIGRNEILTELWAWLSDEYQYTKVLAAEGGKGKTSIAYEFCQLLAKSGTELYDQIIWMTAKQKQFIPASDDYASIPETHYSNLNSLLKEICLKTGALESEIFDFEIHQLQRTAKEALKLIPSFLVIDDIDSNTPDEQRRIMESARVIASNGTKILMTTRVNNIYSADSCIPVPGLSGNDYTNLINSICLRLNLPRLNDRNIRKLETVSEGSPLYSESILRLCKLGHSVEKAITEWEGKSGDTVREAALRKEIAELPQEAIKVLVAICYAGSLSRAEIHQYTDLSEVELTDVIQQLDSLFLIVSAGFIEQEPRLESTSSISKLIFNIAPEILPDAQKYIKRIEEISKGLKAQLSANIPEVGAAVSQCNALLKEERYEEANKTIHALLEHPRYKENKDLYLMLAKISYEDLTSSNNTTIRICREAYNKGQRKPILFEMWYQAEDSKKGKTSALEVCELALKELNSNDVQWGERFVINMYEVAKSTLNDSNKLEKLVRCYGKSLNLIKQVTGSKWREIKDLNVQIVDEIWLESNRLRNEEVGILTLVKAVNAGDKRTPNFERLIDSATNLIISESKKKTLLSEVSNCLKYCPKLMEGEDGKRQGLLNRINEVQENLESYLNKTDFTASYK